MTRIFNHIVCILFTLIANKAVALDTIEVDILADDDYPPYSYLENNELKGIYIDLIAKAAKQLEPKYKVELIAMPWKRALMALERGEELAILPPYYLPKLRPYISPYSTPLAHEQVVVYCHKQIPLKTAVHSMAPITPINLGINAGYQILNDVYLKAVNKQRLILRENKSSDANILKLLKGRIDCYVNDKQSIEFGLVKFQAKNTQLSDITIVEKEVISTQAVYIGYSNTTGNKFPFKDDFIKQMNKAILSLQSNNK